MIIGVKKPVSAMLISTLFIPGCSLKGGSPLLVTLEEASEPAVTIDLRDTYSAAEHVHIACTNNSEKISKKIGYTPFRSGALSDNRKNWIIFTNADGSYHVEAYDRSTIRFCDNSNTETVQDVTEESLTFEKYNGVWLLSPQIVEHSPHSHDEGHF